MYIYLCLKKHYICLKNGVNSASRWMGKQGGVRLLCRGSVSGRAWHCGRGGRGQGCGQVLRVRDHAELALVTLMYGGWWECPVGDGVRSVPWAFKTRVKLIQLFGQAQLNNGVRDCRFVVCDPFKPPPELRSTVLKLQCVEFSDIEWWSCLLQLNSPHLTLPFQSWQRTWSNLQFSYKLKRCTVCPVWATTGNMAVSIERTPADVNIKYFHFRVNKTKICII